MLCYYNMSNVKYQSGFTLIELLIYLALIVTVASTLVLFSLSISETRGKNYVVQEVHANVRTALDIITQRIRAATGVNSVTANSLNLAMADAAKNPTVIDLDPNSRLRISEDSDGPSPAITLITTSKVKVTSLVFTNLTSTAPRENIRIQLTVSYDNPSGDVEYSYSQTMQTSVSVRQ